MNQPLPGLAVKRATKCKERRSPSLLMAQRDNVLVPLTKGGKSNKRKDIETLCS